MVQESPKGSDNKPELNSRGNLGKVVDAPGRGLDSHPKGTEERKRLLPGWVTVLLVISAIATGGYSLYTLFQMGYGRNESSPLSSLSTPEPIQFVAALGRLEPEGEVIQLSASTSQPGERVSELLVEEGDNVRANQVVAIMHDRDRLSAELESAQQQVKIAQAQLAQVKSGAKSGEIAAQEATVARLEAQIPRDIEMQNATIARVQAQVQGDVTAQDATIARVQAQVQGDIQAQQARIERLQAELEEQVNAQQARINRLQAEREGQKTAAQATINRLQAQVRGDIEAQQATINRRQAQVRGDVEAQQATVNRLQAELQRKVEAQQATLSRLRAELANAGVEYRRHEQLFAAGAISESLFDSKRLAVETVFQQMKEAEAVLAEIEQTSRQEIEAARTTLTKLQRAGSKEIEEAQVRLRKLQETGEEQLKEAIANLREIETTKQEQITEAIANLTRIQRTGRSQLSEEQVTLAKLQDTGAEQLREARVKREQLEKTGLEELNEARVARVRIQATGEQQIKEAESTLQSLAEVRTVDVQAAKAEVDRALAQVEEAQARLEEAYVRSPVAGRVMEVHTRPGETIGDNGIVEIGQTEQMYAIAEVYETDIQRVRLGQRATITSDAFEGELQGRVDRIGVQIGKKDVLDTDPTADVDVRVVEVHIRLHPEDSRRVADLTNLQVQVTIATGKADN